MVCEYSQWKTAVLCKQDYWWLWLTRNPEIMVWVTLPGKEPPLAEVLAESRGNTAWVIEEDSICTSFEHTTSYRNKDLFIMLWLCWVVCVCVCVWKITLFSYLSYSLTMWYERCWFYIIVFKYCQIYTIVFKLCNIKKSKHHSRNLPFPLGKE